MSSIKGATTHLLDVATPMVGPALIFFLEGGQQNILVDTGVGGPDGVIAGLASKGLEPGDIDMVIITHLHFDHADNVGLFPGAKFILQKKEWEYAQNPLPVQRDLYDPGTIEQLRRLDLVLVEDDFVVADGVRVILVPGHTQGQQAVAVNTRQGTYVLAGDLLYSYINIYPEIAEYRDMLGRRIRCTAQPDHDFYPPGIHTDLMAWYESVNRVLALAGTKENIIPGHEPGLVGKIIPEP